MAPVNCQFVRNGILYTWAGLGKASGRARCPACFGQRETACSGCGGLGKTKMACPDCKGTGRNPECVHQGGIRQVICDLCEGQGQADAGQLLDKLFVTTSNSVSWHWSPSSDIPEDLYSMQLAILHRLEITAALNALHDSLRTRARFSVFRRSAERGGNYDSVSIRTDATRWVRDHSDGWNHSDWLRLLESLRRQGYWPLN
jgi:hypothetical protein